MTAPWLMRTEKSSKSRRRTRYAPKWRAPIPLGEGEDLLVTTPVPKTSDSKVLAIGGAIIAGVIGIAIWQRKAISNVVNIALNAPEYVTKMWAALNEAFPNMSLQSKLIIMAHGAYESGWGTGGAVKQGAGNDVFNITAGSVSSTKYWDGHRLTVTKADYTYAPKGASQPDSSWEWDSALGQWRKRISQTWRVYPDYKTAVLDYYDFLGPNQNGGRYVTARNALDAGDVAGFARELGLHGYYDANIMDTYVKSMVAMVDTVRNKLGIS